MTKDFHSIDLNCDLGEGGQYDDAIMPLISSANIACGGHAGDPSTMRQCVSLARRHGVEVGAHVSYPDLQGFGRRAMDSQALANMPTLTSITYVQPMLALTVHVVIKTS